MTVVIRQADEGDISDVVRVVRNCTLSMRLARIFQWDDVYPNQEQIEEDSKDGSLYVMRKDEICVAAATFNQKQDDVYQQMEWHGSDPVLVVHRLCVDPSVQGQGLARKMMIFGEKIALEQGYASIRLDAYSGNPRAVGLYESMGYLKVGSVTFPRRDLPFYCFEKNLANKSGKTIIRQPMS